MSQRLHLVYGGELEDPTTKVFRNPDDIDVVGVFPNYETAFNAWKSKAQQSVDNAHARYFIAHLHRLDDEETASSPTQKHG